MTWQAGQSGNPAGTRKSRLVEDALRRAIVQEDAKRIRAGVERVLDLFAEGERWACEFVRDITDGKPVQAISGPDGEPLVVQVVKDIRPAEGASADD